MIERQRVMEAVFRAVDVLNEARPEDKRLEKSLAAELSGPSGTLDSLGLINLVVEVEQAIEDEFHVTVNLADQRAVSGDRDPTSSLSALVDYVHTLVQRQLGE